MSKCYSLQILAFQKPEERDEVLVELCKVLFQYANEYGLKGYKLTNLTFLFPSQNAGPLIAPGFVMCKIHVPDEDLESKTSKNKKLPKKVKKKSV